MQLKQPKYCNIRREFVFFSTSIPQLCLFAMFFFLLFEQLFEFLIEYDSTFNLPRKKKRRKKKMLNVALLGNRKSS